MKRAELQDQVVRLDLVAYTSVVPACVDASHCKALDLFEETCRDGSLLTVRHTIWRCSMIQKQGTYGT